MADVEFEDFEGAYDAHLDGGRAERAKRMINIAGAVCSVALVAGLTLWGYKLAVRDVSGVPVMQALGGAMRIAPTDPGGNQASNQGLSVNAIAAVGTSAPAAEQVTLAPRPVELQADDTAGLIMASGTATAIALPVVQTARLTLSGDASPATATLVSAAVPTDDGAAPPLQAATVTEVSATAAEAAIVPAVARSLRPHARPAALTTPGSTLSKVQNVSAPAPAPEIDPATLTAGTRLAQLGAFDSPDLARVKFGELQTQFGDLMTGKSMVVQAAQSGGRTFFRLRAHGFAGEDDARRFCAALTAEGADCIPVAQR